MSILSRLQNLNNLGYVPSRSEKVLENNIHVEDSETTHHPHHHSKHTSTTTHAANDISLAKGEPNDEARSHQGMSAVPNPVPDTGLPPPGYHGSVHLSSVLSSTSAAATSTPLVLGSESASTSLWSTAISSSATLSMLSTSVLHATSTPFVPPSPIPVRNIGTAAHASSYKMSGAIIALISIGSVSALLAIVLGLRMCWRPRRKPRPKPSLPILEKGYGDEDFDALEEKESPLFGGNERFSPRPYSNTDNWTWSKYTKPASLSPPSAAATKTPFAEERRDSLLSRPKALQQIQTAVGRAVDRLSAASTSFYPATSPLGVAIGSPNPHTAFTGDGQAFAPNGQAVKRSKSKTGHDSAAVYDISSRQSLRQSVVGLAYDGAELASPPLAAMPNTAISSAPAGGGRVKSSYFTSAYGPRASTTGPPSRSPTVPRSVFRAAREQRSSMQRERETRALTAALGLASPAAESGFAPLHSDFRRSRELHSAFSPPSPQQTLYPDDSVSVVAGKRGGNRRSTMPPLPSPRESATPPASTSQPSVAAVAAGDTGLSLGSLMLMDFGTTNQSLAHLGDRLGEGIGLSVSREQERSEPRSPVAKSERTMLSRVPPPRIPPPRIPSPPPIPSLAQMGLQHANPQAYGEYSCPTYSIYGLYQSDSKSRTSNIAML
ncbi:hypothetical protein FISHEDRAFT_62460 [Fistulina hepatica ATCC 64428]|nr:hypothetical protein FISHEDRAFT_62460 [Fistulina hepatica ATCC 64428]